jgi:hypothetical protein
MVIVNKRFVKLIILLAVIYSFPLAKSCQAKLLPRFQKTTVSPKTTSGNSSVPFSISVRIRSDRKAITINLSNVQVLTSVNYMLSYKTNGIDQGAGGMMTDLTTGSVSRELLFGTCSRGACRYHTGITNAKLEVVIKYKTGKQLIKRYKIKV